MLLLGLAKCDQGGKKKPCAKEGRANLPLQMAALLSIIPDVMPSVE